MEIRKVTRGIVIVAAIYLALKLVVMPSLFALIIVGTLPGTSFTIPDWAYMVIAPLLMLSALYWLTKQTFFIGEIPQAPIKYRAPRATSKKPLKAAKKTTAVKRRVKAAA